MEEGKMLSIRFTGRDIEVLNFVSEVGYVEMPQVMRRFSLNSGLVYRTFRRLLAAGLVVHTRLFFSRHGIYYLSPKGAQLTDLPAIDKIAVGQYEHQIVLTDVYIKLQKLYPEARWIGERRLKHEKFFDGIGKRGHVSDGMFLFPDGREIAIEVELSVKGKHRIEKILKGYGAQFSIKEVWYYCSPAVMSMLSSLAQKMSFVKIYSLDEFLS